ncbi:MAG: methyltransferase [Bdellovibrio sp.]|nr:methyltransferase [Bdellovibrio sp.]
MHSLNQEYQTLYHFLSAYAPIWQHEPIASYPANLEFYPKEWIDEFNHPKKLFQLYAKTLDHHTLSSRTLTILLQETLALEQLPHYSFSSDIPDIIFSNDFLTQKKDHELSHLMKYLTESTRNNQCNTVIDVGSGHGHLGRTLASIIPLPIICLEKNEELISQGQEVAIKQGKGKVMTFVEQDLDPDLLKFSPYSPFTSLPIKGPALLIGLHTCGNLALSQILLGLHANKTLINSLINIPCCYFHLHPQLETNLCLMSQRYPIQWTPQSLTLATRAHKRQDEKEYHEMARVKEYRYTLQLFLQEELGILDFFPVGSSHKRLYRKSFSDYATIKFQDLGLPLPGGNAFQAFHERPLTRKKVHELFTMTLLRWRFGRILEKALIIDRALWIKQCGYSVEIFTLFNESISPRNIVLKCNHL